MPICAMCGEEFDSITRCKICGEKFCADCGEADEKLCIYCADDDANYQRSMTIATKNGARSQPSSSSVFSFYFNPEKENQRR